MLKKRVLTAFALLIIIFVMMWGLPPLAFAIAISVFFIISAAEWFSLVKPHHPETLSRDSEPSSRGLTAGSSNLWRYGYALLLIFALIGVYFLPPLPLFFAALILWLWAAAAICSYQSGGTVLGFQDPWVKAVTGILMMAFCWKAIVLLQAASPWWLFAVFVLIWLSDTGAYFSGRRFGRHALADRISPKKTWEGFWGGVLLSVIALTIVSFFLPFHSFQRVLFILLIFICALFAVIGDLFVSLLKRQAGLKDTGSLLPGHGGILDRVDSTISTTPIFALGFLLLKL